MEVSPDYLVCILKEFNEATGFIYKYFVARQSLFAYQIVLMVFILDLLHELLDFLRD